MQLINKFKKYTRRSLINASGLNINRKIIVFESDDWGSIRMPSEEIFNKLNADGIPVYKCPYNSNDSLASEEDLIALFDVLSKFKDKNNRNPIFTANTVVANPDFQKIKEEKFKNYYYEPFIETLKRYPKHMNSFRIWKEGMKHNLFKPQFHGREHLNVSLWMELLQNNDINFSRAFENNMWGLSNNIIKNNQFSIQSAFDMRSEKEIHEQKKIISSGLSIFEEIFGYRSKSFIPNNYTLHSDIKETLKRYGVDYLQGMDIQILPKFEGSKRKVIRHSLGEKNKFGQYYLVRNCFFEPFENPKKDNVESCLKDIESAFFWRKPAVIASHRANYIGEISAINRKNNLRLLEELLRKIRMKWPNSEFMSSDQLGDLIKEN